MGRKFARVSLGGVHDEAEIRGHRRTYIGALPGNIIQAIRKAGARDCVMMLDEIDKMGTGIHGDPASAHAGGARSRAEQHLPRQLSRRAVRPEPRRVHHHRQHAGHHPGPLRDRMEIITLAGYTAGEKLEIAKRYLRAPPARGQRAEGRSRSRSSDAALRRIIEGYTREAGVRSLEREIGRVLRHVAVEIAEGTADKKRIGVDDLEKILGAGALRERGRHALERAGRGHGPRLDAGRRRHPVHRGDAHAGRRQAAR